MIPVNIGVEDELSEAVLRQLLGYLNRAFAIGVAYRRGGNGYLRRNIVGWNEAARGKPFILLTDLDNQPCASGLIADWLSRPQHPNLIFRVAVREVEAWLLADRSNLARYFGVSQTKIPGNPDTLDDPKKSLIAAARESRSRNIRESIVPRRGSTAKVGPDYNGCLIAFVLQNWDIGLAQQQSPSLARTVRRLMTFQLTWG